MEDKPKKRGGTRPNAGRPKGINVHYKNVSICVEESELAELKKRAEESGLTFSRYLVEKGLDRI